MWIILECLYEYLREPPSDITDCNPYSSTSDLVLQCRASVPISEVGNAEIQWFNEGQQITLEGFYPLARVNGIVVELVNGTDRSIITSTLNLDGERFLTQPDQTGGGSYHCQMVVDGSESIAISNQLVIDSNQETYASNGDCSSSITYFEENMSCAKYSPTTTSATTEAATEVETEVAITTPATPTTEDSNMATAPPIAAPAPSTTCTIDTWVYIIIALLVLFGAVIFVMSIAICFLCKRRTTGKLSATN